MLGRATSYRALLELADRAGLGHDLVVQLAYGDSGQTTYFVADERGWAQHRAGDGGTRNVKVMKRIEPREAAIVEGRSSRGTGRWSAR